MVSIAQFPYLELFGLGGLGVSALCQSSIVGLCPAGHGRQPVVPGLGVVGDLRLFPVLLADFHGLFDLGAREHRGGCWRKQDDVECQMGGNKNPWKIPETIPRITLTWQKISSNRED